MEKRKVNSKTLAIVIVSVFLLVLSLGMITYAWFTDSKSYSNTLSFGEISLDVKSGVNETAKTVTFNVTRANGSYATGGKIYPGDTVNISVGLSVKSTSGPAYYLIYLTDSKGYFQEGAYFSDGTNVYFNNGTTTINQATSAEVTDKYVGGIASSSVTHTVNMKAVIDTALDNSTQNTSTDITLKIYAIQQYNLTESDARQELNRVKFTQEYTEKEYLQSTGTQYIDTKYVYKTKPKVETSINLTTDADLDILGTTTKADTCFIVDYYLGNANSTAFMYYGVTTNKNYKTKIVKNTWINVSYGENIIENGETMCTFSGYNFSNNALTLNLFRARSFGLVKMKIVKIYDGDALVRNYIPCVRKTDSKPGMFDIVNGKFYTNSGTGEFSYA